MTKILRYRWSIVGFLKFTMSYLNAFALYQLAKGVEKANQNNSDRLDQLIAADNRRKTDEYIQGQLRDGLANQIQVLENSLSQGPSVAFWNTLQYQIWINENSISQERFFTMDDKERLTEAGRLAGDLNVKARKELSSSDQRQIQAGIRGWSAALLLRKGFVWKTILHQMRPNLAVIQGIIWNGKKFSYVLLGIAVVLHILILPLGWIFVIAMLCLNYWRGRAAKKLALMAETVGGHFDKTAKLSDVKQIVNDCESELESIGVPSRRLTLDQICDAYEIEAGKVYAANERFNLGLNLRNLPLRIGTV